MYYHNSSINYLTTEMGLRQGYAFGTQIRISKEIMEDIKMYHIPLPFLLGINLVKLGLPYFQEQKEDTSTSLHGSL